MSRALPEWRQALPLQLAFSVVIVIIIVIIIIVVVVVKSKNLKIRIYKTIILPVVLYGCETWTLTLREEHRLRMFESRVLSRTA
jgi:hypothetical protein